jgi:hypothetical protein
LKDVGVQVADLDKSIVDFLKMNKPARTQTDAILRIADEFELFHSPNKTAYADVYVEGRRETYPIVSKSFEQLLKGRFYKQTSEATTSEAVRKAIDLLEAKAEFEGPTRPVYVRVASTDEALYIDLGNSDWTAVEIRGEGWGCRSKPARPILPICRHATLTPAGERRINRDSSSVRECFQRRGFRSDSLLASWCAALRRAVPRDGSTW